jgi:hypothetical protein
MTKPIEECKLIIVTTAILDANFTDGAEVLYIGDMNNPPESFYTNERFRNQVATHMNDIHFCAFIINKYYPDTFVLKDNFFDVYQSNL